MKNYSPKKVVTGQVDGIKISYLPNRKLSIKICVLILNHEGGGMKYTKVVLMP